MAENYGPHDRDWSGARDTPFTRSNEAPSRRTHYVRDVGVAGSNPVTPTKLGGSVPDIAGQSLQIVLLSMTIASNKLAGNFSVPCARDDRSIALPCLEGF
jgi:hypothetical protein